MPTTQAEVWDLLRVLIESQRETDRRFQETDRMFQETDREFQETKELLKQQSQETNREFQETKELLKQQSQETDRRFQETNREFQETKELLKRQSQETDRKIKEVSIQIGRLGNRLGDFVEEMVRPALVRIFQQRGLGVHQVLRDLTSYNDQGKMQSQVDLLAIDSDIAVVVECKSHLSVDDVNEHLQRLDIFKANFRQYASFRIQGAVAAMVLPENISQYAARKGLYVLAQSGDAVTIHNDEAFQPRQW